MGGDVDLTGLSPSLWGLTLSPGRWCKGRVELDRVWSMKQQSIRMVGKASQEGRWQQCPEAGQDTSTLAATVPSRSLNQPRF